jgi:hypothetical protein
MAGPSREPLNRAKSPAPWLEPGRDHGCQPWTLRVAESVGCCEVHQVHLQSVHPTGRHVRHVVFAVADERCVASRRRSMLDATSSDGRVGNGPIWSGEARVEVILHPSQSLPCLALRCRRSDCHRDKPQGCLHRETSPAILQQFSPVNSIFDEIRIPPRAAEVDFSWHGGLQSAFQAADAAVVDEHARSGFGGVPSNGPGTECHGFRCDATLTRDGTPRYLPNSGTDTCTSVIFRGRSLSGSVCLDLRH